MSSNNSMTKSFTGRRSLTDCDRASYSAYNVDNEVSVCNFEIQRIGHPAQVKTYPVLDLTQVVSWGSSTANKPAKLASA
eukprot:2316244-Ditylum_brightwellii.AAC.1